MSERRWTPRPWRVGNVLANGEVLIYADRVIVGTAVQMHPWYSAQDNARLMAAAPDMYEAAQKALDALAWASAASDFQPGGQAHEGWARMGKAAIAELQSALAKARGEASER